MKRFYLFLILSLRAFILFSGADKAAEVTIQFTTYDINNGLSDNTVHYINQDSRGFMWFATNDGLVRYDGYSFKNYRSEPDNKNSLGSSLVRCLIEDFSKRFLWVGTQGGGLSKIDLVTDQITTYYHSPDDPSSISGNRIMSLAQDKDGKLWIGTEKSGINLFDPETETCKRYPAGFSEKQGYTKNVTRIFINSRQTVFFCAGRYLLEYQKEIDGFKEYDLGAFPISVYEKSERTLLIGAQDGNIYQFNKADGSSAIWKEDKFPRGRSVFDIKEDSNNNLWIATSGDGLYKYDAAKDKFFNYRNHKAIPYSISSNRLFCLYISEEGVVWVGTRGGGLNKFIISQEHFGHYSVNPDTENSIIDNVVFSLAEDTEGNLWLGFEKGQVSRFNRKSGTFSHYQLKIVGFSVAFVHEIYVDPDGTIWAAGWGLGVHRYNRQTDRFDLIYTRNEQNHDDPESISTYDIMALYRDSHNQFWIGVGYAAQNRIDLNTGKIYKYVQNRDDPYAISDNEVTKIYEDSKGDLWFSTFSNGINRYDRKNDRFISYKSSNAPDSLSGNTVYSMAEDKDGQMWFGTFSGLSLFNRDTETFTRYSEADGLLHDVVYGLEVDNDNNLWLSGGKGLCMFNPRENSFEYYNWSNGLQSNLFSWSVSGKTKAGELMFGGVNGFNIFNPRDIQKNTNPPRTVITDLKLFNRSIPVGDQSILQKNIEHTERLVFTHLDDVISFEFSTLSFTAPLKNSFKYKLEGFEKEWNYVDSSRRFATYTTLPAGKYTFIVEGANNDGRWNTEGASIDITVLPPFWETWWFYTLVILAIFFIIGWIFFQTVVRLKAEKEASLLEQKIELAKHIQTALLPEKLDHPELEFSAMMMPADEVGGDYYDICYDRNNELWISIGDVSGHGVTAGLIMMMAQTAHYESIQNYDDPQPDQVIRDVNSTLRHNIYSRLGNNSFMSFTTMKYKGKGRFCFAGLHLDILIHRKETESVEAVRTEGIFLNMIAAIKKLENKSLKLEIGDTMLLFTDGVIEARNSQGKMLDFKNLKIILKKHSSKGVEELKKAIYEDTINWGGRKLKDDLTLLVIRRIK